MTVAVIQPMWIPYAGYFRLFEAADVVVMFDDVQHIQRGFVHRQQFRLANGEAAWLTLPLQPCPRSTLIMDLEFAPGASKELYSRMQRFPLLAKTAGQILVMGRDTVADYLIDLLRYYVMVLKIGAPLNRALGVKFIRSSDIVIGPNLHGQDRVIAICKSLGADRYVNPSGGRALYDAATFAKNGIQLGFLAPYTGSYESILTRLLTENAQDVADEIRRESTVEWML